MATVEAESVIPVWMILLASAVTAGVVVVLGGPAWAAFGFGIVVYYVGASAK